MLRTSCSERLVSCRLIVVSLMSAHSSWVLRTRPAEQEGFSFGGQGSATFPGSECLLSKVGEWEVGEDKKKGKKNIPYQTKWKCFQLLSGKEILEMTSSQHSLIFFCYEPSNPLHFPDWQMLSEHLNPESLGHPFPSSFLKLLLLFFSSLFLNHSLYNSCFSH